MPVPLCIKNIFTYRPKSLGGWILTGLTVGLFAVIGQMIGNRIALSNATNELEVNALKHNAGVVSTSVIEGACQVLPINERYKLSPECQERLTRSDIEQARFLECFRLLNTAGVTRGDCDTPDRRYVLDLKGTNPRVIALAKDGNVLYQIKLAPVTN